MRGSCRLCRGDGAARGSVHRGLLCAAGGGIAVLMSPVSEADYRERMRSPVSGSPSCVGALGPAAMPCGIPGSASLLRLLSPHAVPSVPRPSPGSHPASEGGSIPGPFCGERGWGAAAAAAVPRWRRWPGWLRAVGTRVQICAGSREAGGRSLSPRAARDGPQQRLKLAAPPEVDIKTSF